MTDVQPAGPATSRHVFNHAAGRHYLVQQGINDIGYGC